MSSVSFRSRSLAIQKRVPLQLLHPNHPSTTHARVSALAMSLPDESNIEEAQAKEGNTVKDSGRFKRSTYVGVGSFTSQTLIKYVPNGKKAGTKSAERYNVYAEARTVQEALSLGSRVADFLNDFEKGLLRPVGGVVRDPGEEVSAEEFAALSKLDQTLYNFARRARGDARLGKSGKAKAQRRAAVKNEGGRKPRTNKEHTERLQMWPEKRH